MRIAHLSDTHLGYRNYSRMTPEGVNQREHDVFMAFRTCLEDILDEEPDVILHTGDFFDGIRPGNRTLVAAHKELAKVQAKDKRAGAPFIIVAGNHETPRSVEAGCILRLFGGRGGDEGIRGVYVVDSQIGELDVGDLMVYCVPSSAMAKLPEVSPVPRASAKVNIVAAHGLASNIIPLSAHFDLSHFRPDKWDYLALGDYHLHKAVAENAVYSGSTEFTTTNIWEEAGTKKGWVLFDSDIKKWEFREITTPRAVVELTEINGDGLSAAEITELMLANAVWIEGSMPIVRQRVVKVAPPVRAEIKATDLRNIHERALHYKHEFSFASSESSTGSAFGGGRSLVDNWKNFAGNRELPQSIKREVYVERGEGLLQEATNAAEEA